MHHETEELTILTYPYFGTNVLGMLWALIGLFPTSIAVATIEMPQVLAGILLLSGVVISILLDAWWRARSQLVKGWRRYFRSVSGGCVVWLPYWLSWFVLVPIVFAAARR